MNSSFSFALAFSLSCSSIACAQTAVTEQQSDGPTMILQEPEVSESPAKKLLAADWEAVQKEVAKQRGKVVVVDLWSTSCLPCMQEFPRLVELQKKHPKTVVCVGVNLDYIGIKSKPPEYYRPRVEKFLKSVKAEFRNYLCTVPSDQLFEQMKLNSIPAVLVYGPDGKLSKRFDATLLEPGEEEPFNYEDDINPWVEKLIQTKAK